VACRGGQGSGFVTVAIPRVTWALHMGGDACIFLFLLVKPMEETWNAKSSLCL